MRELVDNALAGRYWPRRWRSARPDAGWYNDSATGKAIDRNVGEMLALVHSEITEAPEGYREGLMDDHLSHRRMVEVELADAMIRIAFWDREKRRLYVFPVPMFGLRIDFKRF